MFDVAGMDPITSHQGALYMDGVHQTNCTGFNMDAAVETKESRVIGQQSVKPRVRAIKFSGKMTFYKRSPWLAVYANMVQQHQYQAPFNLVGMIDDEGSDYGREQGTQTVTYQNCVIDGSFTIMQTDTNCDDVVEEVSFIAEKMVL